MEYYSAVSKEQKENLESHTDKLVQIVVKSLGLIPDSICSELLGRVFKQK